MQRGAVAAAAAALVVGPLAPPVHAPAALGRATLAEERAQVLPPPGVCRIDLDVHRPSTRTARRCAPREPATGCGTCRSPRSGGRETARSSRDRRGTARR